MATDPRLNLINFGLTAALSPTPADNCNTAQGVQLSASLSLNTKLGNLSLGANVGAFQNLAVGGGGQVGLGLRNLASISDQIRIGGPGTAANLGLPTSSSAGSEFVLGQVGLSSSSLSGASNVNASVSLAASNQSAQIFNQVSQGQFTSSMVTPAFSNFQNAVSLIASIFTPPTSTPQNTQFGQTCGASPYAVDLIKLAPKYKFLFVVQFEFDPAFQSILSHIDPAFVIKSSSRPTIDFEYEDINMYNFRTKVPRKTIYQDMNMRFYDDNRNNAFQFYSTYLKLMSPIANVDIEKQSMNPLDAYDNVGGGMGFDEKTQKINTAFNSGTVGQGYAASLGPYGSDPSTRNILRKITLFHVYRNGRMMNVYNFYNPKIKALKLDDLDMTQTGDGSEVSFDFSYDSVFIIPGYRVAFNNTNAAYNLPSLTGRNAQYPFGVAPGSIPSDNNPKDGQGLDYGQNTESSNSLAATIPTPSTISPDLTSIVGSVPTVGIPADSSGGVDTNTSVAGSADQLSDITTTAQRIPDPVTGIFQQSADNTADLSNSIALTPEQASAQSFTDALNRPSTTFNSQAAPKVPFVGGGGQSGGGGASGSF